MSRDTSRYERLKEWGHPDVQYQHGPAREDHHLVIDGFKVPAITNVVIEDDADAACPKVTVTFLAASVNARPATPEQAYTQQASALFESLYRASVNARLERLEALLTPPEGAALTD